MKKQRVAVTVVITCELLLTGCSDSATAPTPNPNQNCPISFSIGGVSTLYLGESTFWRARGQNSCLPPKEEPIWATWQSLNPEVATVQAVSVDSESSSEARITGVTAGTATIVAVSSGTQARATVTVLSTVQPPPSQLRIDLTLSFPGATPIVHIGDRRHIYAYAEWPDRGLVEVSSFGSWSSTSPDVATVSASGFLSAVGAGTTDISISYLGLSTTFTLTVLP